MEAPKLRDRLYPGAERSTFVWTETGTLSRVAEAGCGVHILQKASHYVHVDNRTTLASVFSSSCVSRRDESYYALSVRSFEH